MNTKTTARPKPGGMARANKARAIKASTGTRTAARRRTKIEALFDELTTERMAGLWQRLCPLALEADCELPVCRGMIEDLTDFAQVLQPNLDGIDTDQLCWLLERCGGACEARGAARQHRRAPSYGSLRHGHRRYRQGSAIPGGCELL
jgi:hypothetical protein